MCVPFPMEMPPRQLEDNAHVIGTVRTGLASWNNSGFLKWDPAGSATPPGSSDAATFTAELQAMIAAAGERGCGFEAPLEAMYRFLVDPEPWLSIANDGLFTTLSGVDTTAPEIACNAPARIAPPNPRISFTATSTDACDANVVAEVTGFTCLRFNGSGKPIDKSGSCGLTFDGSTVTIPRSNGVGDHITWTVRAEDASGNVSEVECMVEVAPQGQG